MLNLIIIFTYIISSFFNKLGKSREMMPGVGHNERIGAAVSHAIGTILINYG